MPAVTDGGDGQQTVRARRARRRVSAWSTAAATTRDIGRAAMSPITTDARADPGRQ